MLHKKIKSFLNGKGFINHVATLCVGAGLSQAITLLSSPLLTRLYTPEDFGALSLFRSCLSIMSIIACLRYEQTIPLPKQDEEAFNLLLLCFAILLSTGSFFTLTILLYAEKIINILNINELSSTIYLLPIGFIATGCYTILNYWAIREKAFSTISSTKIFQKIYSVTFQIFGGVFSCGAIILALGSIIGNSSGVIRFLHILKQTAPHRCALQIISIQNYIFLLKKYKDFPMSGMLGATLDMCKQVMPTFLFTHYASLTITGYYFLAETILTLPITLIGKSINQAYYTKLLSDYRENKLHTSIEKMISLLAKIALIPFSIFIIIAPTIFSFIWGSAWKEAGTMASWLAIPSMLIFIFSPLSNIFSITRRLKLSTIYHFFTFLLRMIGFFVGLIFFASTDIIISYSIFSAIGTLFGIYTIIFISKANIIKILYAIKLDIIFSILILVASLLLQPSFLFLFVIIPLLYYLVTLFKTIKYNM